MHCSPIWLRLGAPLISSLRFCRSPPAPLISILILTSPLVKQPSVHCQRLIRFLSSSPSGTDLVSWYLGQWSSLPFLTQYIWLLSGCICPSQWGLAFGTAYFILRDETQRRRCPCGGLPASRLQHPRGSYLQMWSHGPYLGTTRPDLQAGRQQNSQA